MACGGGNGYRAEAEIYGGLVRCDTGSPRRAGIGLLESTGERS